MPTSIAIVVPFSAFLVIVVVFFVVFVNLEKPSCPS